MYIGNMKDVSTLLWFYFSIGGTVMKNFGVFILTGFLVLLLSHNAMAQNGYGGNYGQRGHRVTQVTEQPCPPGTYESRTVYKRYGRGGYLHERADRKCIPNSHSYRGETPRQAWNLETMKTPPAPF